MSNVNIKRVIENIRSNTTVYTPVVEIVVNAIQAIESKGEAEGKIFIRVKRDGQLELDGGLPNIQGFEIEDNGIGFTDEHRESFDTLYTDLKIEEGGKGFGRFICLKYFKDLKVESIYRENGYFKRREFKMGNKQEIIVEEKRSESSEKISRTIVYLNNLKKDGSFDKKLSTVARNLVDKLLPFFITEDYKCPNIYLCESNGADQIKLNDYCSNELSALIKEIRVENNNFSLTSNNGEEHFLVRIFKFYSPKNQKSKISLVAHKREVSGSSLSKYIPEFSEEFYEKKDDEDNGKSRNYILKAYVFGNYLDRNVSLERGGFEFSMENDLLLGISQNQIESESSDIAKKAVGQDIILRQEKKNERFKSYVNEEAPWHREYIDKIDLSDMPYNPTNEEIETRLQKEKFNQEVQIKKEVEKVLAESSLDSLEEDVRKIVTKITGSSRNDLIHYIALRRNIIDIFERSLESDETGKFSSEGVVHDIIFPRKGDSDITSFENHNLWIIDERLNFTNFISSDKELNGKNSERPDLLVFNNCIVFRGDNEASNPITIFEFKKPQRDDFANASSKEDPVQQIVRYTNNIRDGKYKMPKGRKIQVTENTQFYGYVVCDLTAKVEEWLDREKWFTQMPDGLGWFQWSTNINLYIEVLSWDKLLKDAKMRNKIFFHKLGI